MVPNGGEGKWLIKSYFRVPTLVTQTKEELMVEWPVAGDIPRCIKGKNNNNGALLFRHPP